MRECESNARSHRYRFKTQQQSCTCAWYEAKGSSVGKQYVAVSTWNVLLGVEEVVVQGVLAPHNTLLLVGLGVGESLGGSGGAAEKPAQVRPLPRSQG